MTDNCDTDGEFITCQCECEYDNMGYCNKCGHYSTMDSDYGDPEGANEG